MADSLIYAGFFGIMGAAIAGLYLFFVKYGQHRSRGGYWWKLPLGNFLIFLFAGSLLVLLGETYYRFWYDSTDSFAFTKTSELWFRRHYHLNQMGYRDDQEYSSARRPGKRRITFVGDSFAAGQGIRDVNERFANRIRKLHPEWEIHVLAKCGYDSGDELTLLDDLARTNYDFDEVVLVYCLNDIGDATQKLIDRHRKAEEQCNSRCSGFLLDHSYLLNTLFYRMWTHTIPELSGYFDWQHSAYFGLAWEAHTPRLKAMRDIVRSRGGELAVVTFPYMHSMGPNYEFRDVHQKLDAFWQNLEVPHLDLLGVYEPYRPRQLVVNAYDAHPNELANVLAAEAIAKFLEGQPWLKASKQPAASVGASQSPDVTRSDKLIACYQKILEIDPRNVLAHFHFGEELSRRGQLEGASDQFQEALKIEPADAAAHYYLGMVRAAQGNMAEAIAQYRAALDINPDYVEAHYNLGVALASRGQIDAAIEHYQHALKIRPELAEAHNNLGSALRGRGQIDAAIEHYKKALAIKPDYVEAHTNLGVTLAGRGQFDEAIAEYRRALEIKPEFAGAHYSLGAALAARGERDAAAAELQKALELARDQHNSSLAEIIQAQIRHYEEKTSAATPPQRPLAQPAPR